MKAGSNSSAGLTLLETILAISMLGMILTALHVALSSGVGAYRRCRDTSDRATMAYSAIRLITDDLQRLALPDPLEPAPCREAYRAGSRHGVRFEFVAAT